MKLYDIRYELEHKQLPQRFFKEKANFIDLILKNKEIIFNIIDNIFKDENEKNIYSKEDFDVIAGKVTDEVSLMKIIFPKPEIEPLCYCSYVFFDKKYKKIAYYCIEKGNEANNFTPYVASWTIDGHHTNHGLTSIENNADLLKCVDLYMEKEFNLKRKNP